MHIIKGAVALFGAMMVAMGLLWIGQGLNLIQWPAGSFMIGAPQWSWNGLGLALAGGILAAVALRRGRS